ncbi:hypothetical protein ACLVWU_04785 [Bdellovibrio sp. HCB290]|uniref:hypothetical protein n=1 Tax=Bdellovibrio sp. HCB290 TaxID=3394356 RepID=UPI0039B524E4
MKHLLILATLLFGLQSHAIIIGGDHAGNGGNDVGIEFESAFNRAINNIKRSNIPGMERLAQMDLTPYLTELKVIVVNEPLEVTVGNQTQECVAINYRIQQTVKVNSTKWKEIRSESVKEGIALHEILSLVGLEESGKYTHSARYLSFFSVDPATTYRTYPVSSGDLQISKIEDDRVSAANIVSSIPVVLPNHDVTANLLTVFAGGAAGMSRIIFTISDSSEAQAGRDGQNSVTYDITYVNNPPTDIKLAKVSEYFYKISFNVVAVIYKDGEFSYKDKFVTAEVRLDNNYVISEVKFK